MMPFDAIEVMGRERREALMAEAENDRSTRPARLRARRRLIGQGVVVGAVDPSTQPAFPPACRRLGGPPPGAAADLTRPGPQRALTIASAVIAK